MNFHGKDIIILKDYEVIAAATSCDVNVDVETIKVSSPTDGQWQHSIAGRKSWQASLSHLVTSIKTPANMVGETVTLQMKTVIAGALPFSAFVNNVTYTIATQSMVTDVVWDTTHHQFLGLRNGVYYERWISANGNTKLSSTAYQNIENVVYEKDGEQYTVTEDGELVREVLEGTAIVREWKLTATRGNLAQGSFRFEGTGPLE